MGVNNGELRAFRSQRAGRGRVLSLRGTSGNPLAAGARVTLVGEEWKRVHEIHQGSGYLSQSTPVVFLDAEVTRVEVRWPDGSASSRGLGKDEDFVVLEQPGDGGP